MRRCAGVGKFVLSIELQGKQSDVPDALGELEGIVHNKACVHFWATGFRGQKKRDKPSSKAHYH